MENMEKKIIRYKSTEDDVETYEMEYKKFIKLDDGNGKEYYTIFEKFEENLPNIERFFDENDQIVNNEAYDEYVLQEFNKDFVGNWNSYRDASDAYILLIY